MNSAAGKNGSALTTRDRAIAILYGNLTRTPTLGKPPSGVPVLEAEMQSGKETWAVVARGEMAEKLARIPSKVKIRVIGQLTQHKWDAGNTHRLRPVILAQAVHLAKQRSADDKNV